ncbi:MAG: rhomboid family intramembrane serine protease [Bacteroidales bacterium]|nr:rhomboid family intramembrane serine protease [Bacteroidales bacterium]
MENIFIRLKAGFKRGDFLYRLIFINTLVFLIASLWLVVTRLFNLEQVSFLRYFELPSNLHTLLLQVWSFFTYMFLHTDFLHLLFNMLWLYWFGKMALKWFSEKQIVGIYILGGLFGGILYILAYNLFPMFNEVVYSSYLLGASASVLAIVVATAMIAPNESVFLMFLGAVKLKYIAIFVVALSFVNVISDNAGGNIAHLGGALFGYLFVVLYMKGYDMTKWINKIFDKIVDWFKPAPKMKVRKGGRQMDMDYNKRKKEEMDEIDAILDKLKRSGYDGLSSDEKKKLFNAGKK